MRGVGECKKMKSTTNTVNKLPTLSTTPPIMSKGGIKCKQGRTRRGNGCGSIIARNGRWAMRWRVDGRTVQEQTDFKVGVKADRARAEALLNERTEIFRLKREEDQLAILIRRRETIEQRLRKLQADAMPATRPLTLARSRRNGGSRRAGETAARRSWSDTRNSFARL